MKRNDIIYIIITVVLSLSFLACILDVCIVDTNCKEYSKVQDKVIMLYEQAAPSVKDSICKTETYLDYQKLKK